MLLLLALAAGFSLPVPFNDHTPDVRALFSADDFPPYLKVVGLQRTVYTRTTVLPDGTIQGCVAETSSGDPRLDADTCRLIVKRARFLPARWIDGSAAYGVFRLPVRWTITDERPSEGDYLKAEVPDLELSVDHLPKGAHSIVGVILEVGADEHGKPVACAEWQPAKNDRSRRFPELASVACQQVMARVPLSPPVDSSATPMRSVQTVSVHFEVGH